MLAIHNHANPDTKPIEAFLARISRGPLDILDFVESYDDLGAPDLSEFAPDVNEVDW